ncbi:hypothetical protein A0256_09550 [Mucilaginibacter sp. PAMC 26640]|nr:hypothetical protein A0256_09550 [Mucilaginibacter sp. PAMC 26640]
MSMQDKEFDELFRSKLGSFESEPSRERWDSIASEVNLSKPGRSALPFIGIAASILIVITAGVFFLKPSKVTNVKADQVIVARNRQQPKVTMAPQYIPPAAVVKVQEPVIALAPQNIIKRRNIENSGVVKQEVALAVVNPGEAAIEEHPLAGVQKQPDVLAVTLPPVQSLVSNAEKAPAKLNAQPDVAVGSVQVPPVKAIALTRLKKRGISTFGDLINVVVASVDKRKDKLIEFSNKDDDESLVTGLNLGIVKVKKEEVIATNK